MSDYIVEFNNFSWRYVDTEVNALNDVTLQIKKGEFVGIMGQNGAGKTTLCRCINGLIPHRFRGSMAGSIVLDGQYDTFDTDIDVLSRMVGMVSSDPDAQFLRGTVEEEIVFAAENAGVAIDEISARLDLTLDRVNLNRDFLSRPPTNLSGGQKQRVAIAASLMVNPHIMVLDEPTSQIDPIGKIEVIEVLEKIRQQEDMTIILVEHRSDEILKYADKVVLIDEGNILLNEPPKQFFQNIELLLSKGVYPPQVAQFAKLIYDDPNFASLNLEGKNFPLTVEEGVAFVKELLGKNRPNAN